MTAREPLRPLFLAAAAALLVGNVVVARFVLQEAWEPGIYTVTAMGIPYLLASGLVLTQRVAPSLALIVVVAVLLRLVALPLDPYFSSDMYRYIWEGRIQAAGFSPYLHIPADPVLTSFRDEIWANVNRADYAPTIYPPVAQAFFFLVTRVSESVLAMKVAMVACEALAAWAAARLLDDLGLPRRMLIVLLWAPIAVWEVAGNGHVDALMAALVALALLASRRGRDGLAGLALGAAVMTKFLPLAIAPALWRRWDLKFPVTIVAVVVAGYAPHILVAGREVIGFMPGYAAEEGMESGLAFWPMRLFDLAGLTPPLVVFLGCVAALGAAMALRAVFVPREASRPLLGHALALAAVALIAISPAFPWYFLWLLVILTVRPFWPLLWVMATSPLLYMDYGRSVPLIVAIVYGGTVVLSAFELFRRRL